MGELLENITERPTPVSLRSRLRITVAVGAVVGAALGLIGFLIATVSWSGNATADNGTVSIVTGASGLMWRTALVSILFGAITSALARSVASWSNPGMRLRASPAATAGLGAAIGFVFGFIAGAALAAAVGAPVDGQENMVQLPVLGTLAVMVIGGAVLGAATTAITQAVATPVVVDEDSEEELTRVRGRLGAAVRIPVTALLFLLFLVIPLGWTLVEVAHLSEFAAPILAVVVAGGILGFATLGGSKPNMRFTMAEFGVALGGILVVVGTLLAVLFTQGPAPHGAHGPGGTVTILAKADIGFDAHEWSVPEGDVTFVYDNEGDTVHTLAVEGREEDMELRVAKAGDSDTGELPLPPGTYTVYCTIRGHRDLGMEGTLTVEKAPEEPPPGA